MTNLLYVLKCCRAVFSMEGKNHGGHMDAVKQNVLDGTSKWSAKIAITGLHKQKPINYPKIINENCRNFSKAH